MGREPELDSIRKAVSRAELRLRLRQCLIVLPTVVTVTLGVAGVALASHKVWPGALSRGWTVGFLYAMAVAAFTAVVVSGLRRLPPRAGALLLDRFHGLQGRITNALEFSETEEGSKTPLMAAAISDACSVSDRLSARDAVRMTLPREWMVSLCVAAVVAGIAVAEVKRPTPHVIAASTDERDGLQMNADDLQLFRQAIDALEGRDQNPEIKNAVEKFNDLIEKIADHKLNRADAFRQMQQIDRDLKMRSKAEKKDFLQALKNTAKELERSKLTKAAAERLRNNDLTGAQKEMKNLARRLRDPKRQKPSAAELKRLRDALRRAGQRKQKALAALEEQRAALRKDLLKLKSRQSDPQNKNQKRERNLLKKKKRALERLDRLANRKQQSMRRLSKLDRDLAKAAADLMRDLGASADDLDQVAEELNRLQKEELTDKDKEELRRRLQELRELIRRQGQGGKKMRQRLKRFLRRAGGGRGTRPGGRPSPGGQDPTKPGGAGGKKRGAGLGSGKMALIPVPGAGAGAPGGDGSAPGGKKWGSGAGGNPKGKATDLKGTTYDVRAEGLDTGQGPTNEKVILSAAQRGFSGGPYKKVFKDYKTVAEDRIRREKIPDGMRFYVRRYFQLIRPRE